MSFARIDARAVPVRSRRALRQIGRPCPFCGVPLVRENVSFDHEPPILRMPEYARAAEWPVAERRRLRRSLKAISKRYGVRAPGDYCCRACNSRKGGRTRAEFVAWLASPPGAVWLRRAMCGLCWRRWGPPIGPYTTAPCPRCRRHAEARGLREQSTDWREEP